MTPLWWLLALTACVGWLTDTNHPDRLSWLTLGLIVAGCLALVVWPHVSRFVRVLARQRFERWVGLDRDSIAAHRAMLDALKDRP